MNYNMISQLLDNGLDSDQLIALLVKNAPNLGSKIKKLLSGGWGSNEILSYIQKDPETSKVNFKNAKPATPEEIAALQIYKSRRGADKSRDEKALEDLTKFTQGALKWGSTAAGVYGAGRALFNRAAQAAIPEILPAVQDAFNPRQGVEINVTPRIAQQTQQIEFQPPQKLIEQSKSPQSNIPPQAAPQIPNQPQVPKIDFGQVLDQLGVKNKVDALRANNSPEIVSKIVRYGLPKDQIKQLESQLQMPIDQVIEGYLQSAPPLESLKDKIAKGVNFSSRNNQVPNNSEESVERTSEITPLNQNPTPIKEDRFKEAIEQGKKKFDEWRNTPTEIEEIPEKPKNRELKIQRGSTVALPDGKIGEIQNIRQGIAEVNVNGKIRRQKAAELEKEPEGLEEATRHLVSLIPEKEKSSAFQESIHLTIPVMEGKEIPIMLTKYYGGKWAWYLGVSNDDYSNIALGTFEPKGEKKTGIAEYKPGVIDSRGAGNHQLIIQNPKYSKENKGKTWGYADNKYDMLKSIEEILKKMSKEELDEEGNIKQKRKK